MIHSKTGETCLVSTHERKRKIWQHPFFLYRFLVLTSAPETKEGEEKWPVPCPESLIGETGTSTLPWRRAPCPTSSWLTPAPGNPPGSSKPPWVCTGQNWEFKPHVTAHRSISVHLIGFWKKTGSYLTVLVVVLPECLRKARNSDFCVECFNWRPLTMTSQF